MSILLHVFIAQDIRHAFDLSGTLLVINLQHYSAHLTCQANRSFSESYAYRSGSVIATNYLFNGLKWRYVVGSESYIVTDESIAWAKNYWKGYLSGLKK